VNPGRQNTANAATTNESRTAPQRQSRKPQCKDHDAELRYVIGLDLSDRTAHYAVLGPAGEVWRTEKKIQLNRDSLRRHFAEYAVHYR
jgi:hypothetical protein